MKDQFAKFAEQYHQALFLDVLPFWERHSVDREFGGYFTCLERDGTVFDSDKFVWLQARQVWTFSMLYNQVEKRQGWLEMARHGTEFLRAHGMEEDGKWYFSLDRTGKPLVQPYSIFSDCFVAMAFGQYALAAEDESAGQLAQSTYRNILKRQYNPKGQYNKAVPGTRPFFKNFALPMILCNLVLELESWLDGEDVEAVINTCLHEVMEIFLDRDRGLIYENIGLDGRKIDSFDGRLINPGHGIEAMWFIMDVALRRDDHALLERAAKVVLDILSYSWDDEYGGIFYFMDAEGHPPQQLEWDQKLWWVHLETMVALITAYRHTGRPEYWQWYEKVHEYTWRHFPDPDHGEWYGYLNRRGETHLSLKGGKWKGCFHVPRALYRCWKEFEVLSA